MAVGVPLLACAPAASGQVLVVTVPVGHPANPRDLTGFGSVTEEYRIGRTEITNRQYAAFLNAVATIGDPYALYDTRMGRDPQGGIMRSGQGTPAEPYRYVPEKHREEEPVHFVSFYDAVRFKLPGGLGGGLLPADLHLSGGGGPGSDILFRRDSRSDDDLIARPADQEDFPPFDEMETSPPNADGDSQFTPDPSVNDLDDPVLPPPGAPPEPTPEPSTLWLLLFGTACLRRRR